MMIIFFSSISFPFLLAPRHSNFPFNIFVTEKKKCGDCKNDRTWKKEETLKDWGKSEKHHHNVDPKWDIMIISMMLWKNLDKLFAHYANDIWIIFIHFVTFRKNIRKIIEKKENIFLCLLSFMSQLGKLFFLLVREPSIWHNLLQTLTVKFPTCVSME